MAARAIALPRDWLDYQRDGNGRGANVFEVNGSRISEQSRDVDTDLYNRMSLQVSEIDGEIAPVSSAFSSDL
jgi:hypothetical protein